MLQDPMLQDPALCERFQRTSWELADFRVKIASVGNGCFCGVPVEGARYTINCVPLVHIERIELSKRQHSYEEQAEV